MSIRPTLADAHLEVFHDAAGFLVLGFGEDRLSGLQVAPARVLQPRHRQPGQGALEVVCRHDATVQQVRVTGGGTSGMYIIAFYVDLIC